MRASCWLLPTMLSEVQTRTQASAFMVGPKAFEVTAAWVLREAPWKPDLRAGEKPGKEVVVSLTRRSYPPLWFPKKIV